MKINCTCKHKGQDKLHGKGVRIANPAKPTATRPTARCTVCGKEKEV